MCPSTSFILHKTSVIVFETPLNFCSTSSYELTDVTKLSRRCFSYNLRIAFKGILIPIDKVADYYPLVFVKLKYDCRSCRRSRGGAINVSIYGSDKESVGDH